MRIGLGLDIGMAAAMGGGGFPWVQTATFESGGTTGADAFDSLAGTNQGNMTNAAAAALVGAKGCRVNMVGAQTSYGLISTQVTNEKIITLELWVDPNSVTMADNDNFRFLNGGIFGAAFYINWRFFTPNYNLNFVALDDAAAAGLNANFNISDVPQKLRIEWSAASAPGANDGIARIYIDDVQKAAATNIDNDTLSIGQFEFGACGGVDAGTSGPIYLDHLRWARRFL